MCRIEGWSTRTLDKKIQTMLFVRTALSRKPEKLAEMEPTALRDEDKLTPDLVFQVAFLKKQVFPDNPKSSGADNDSIRVFSTS